MALNQENHPEYNREPGIVIVDGSNLQKELAKFEQFPSRFTGTGGPGNPYKYRPYPKALYRAEHWNGKVVCGAAPPDPVHFSDPREYERAAEAARKFTEQCTRNVADATEQQRAMEDGWREHPQEAVDYLLSRDRSKADSAAHLNYEDRNLSEPAKREKAVVLAAADGHVAEVPEKPRRGRPRKVQSAA